LNETVAIVVGEVEGVVLPLSIDFVVVWTVEK